MNRPRTPQLLAVTAAALTLLLPASTAAAAGGHHGQPTHPCFLPPTHWNQALDGPIPRCYLRT